MREPRETLLSKSFVNILAILSIIGFSSIISYTIFNFDATQYVETLWLIILGAGFIIESQPQALIKNLKSSLTSRNFTSITTLTLGILAIISGTLSVPQIGITNPAFLAVKGIMSIIAIIFIVVQTWILK